MDFCFSFDTQCRFSCQSFDFFIDFLVVVSWDWAKNSASSAKDRILNTSCSSGTGSLLLFDFTGTTYNFRPFLRLVCSLSFVSQMLFYIQIYGMIIRINAKNRGFNLTFLPVSFPLLLSTDNSIISEQLHMNFCDPEHSL